MSPEHFDLIRRLLRAAAVDQTRTYSATWSLSRLRTMLTNKVLGFGHRVIDAEVPGTPSYTNQALAQHALHVPAPAAADLTILEHPGDRVMYVDLQVASAQAAAGSMTFEMAYDKIMRITAGQSDVLLISADADAYDRARSRDSRQRGPEDPRLKVVAAVLPAYSKMSVLEPHHVTLGDLSVELLGVKCMAFGTPRVACAMYVRWDV